MKLREYSSLGFRMSLASIFVIALALLFYSWLQFMADPSRSIGDMLENLIWQIILLGALIYLSLQLVLRRVLMKPLHRIYMKMYAVTRGDYDPVEIKTDVRELQDVANGLNMMLAKLREEPDEESHRAMQTDAERLRALSEDESFPVADDVREWMRDMAARLERHTRHLTL